MSYPYWEASEERDYSKRQGGKKSKPSSQKQMSRLRLFVNEPILSRPEEWVFVFLT